jgi:hypothetical protein
MRPETRLEVVGSFTLPDGVLPEGVESENLVYMATMTYPRGEVKAQVVVAKTEGMLYLVQPIQYA